MNDGIQKSVNVGTAAADKDADSGALIVNVDLRDDLGSVGTAVAS